MFLSIKNYFYINGMLLMNSLNFALEKEKLFQFKAEGFIISIKIYLAYKSLQYVIKFIII